MSLRKAIEHGKEHRKPYYGSKDFDKTCRNHGGCPWCEENRKYKYLKKEEATRQQLKEEEREVKTMWTTYWWGIEDENSEICGEEFFTELKNADAIEHKKYVKKLFPNEKPVCYGMVTEEEAEMMGLDTY